MYRLHTASDTHFFNSWFFFLDHQPQAPKATKRKQKRKSLDQSTAVDLLPESVRQKIHKVVKSIDVDDDQDGEYELASSL